MNRNRKNLGMLVAIGALAMAGQTRATTIDLPFADADLYNPGGTTAGGASIAAGGSLTGNFDIVNADSDSTFTVSSLIYTAAIGGKGDIYNSHLGFDNTKDTVIDGVAKFWFHDVAHKTFEVDMELDKLSGTPGGSIAVFEESIGTSVILKLNLDGNVDYTVSNSAGTPIRLDYAYLGVDVKSTKTSAPDGGTTAMLLGAGLLGVAGFRRKLS